MKSISSGYSPHRTSAPGGGISGETPGKEEGEVTIQEIEEIRKLLDRLEARLKAQNRT